MSRDHMLAIGVPQIPPAAGCLPPTPTPTESYRYSPNSGLISVYVSETAAYLTGNEHCHAALPVCQRRIWDHDR